MTSNLPAYRITTASGFSYVTSTAPAITIDQARAYFIGAPICIEPYPSEKTSPAVKVEVAE